MYEVLGFLNITLLAIITLPFLLRMANKWFFHTKDPRFFKLLKYLRAVHKPAAAALIISIILHAYLALGSFRLHTGTIVTTSLVVTALLGLTYYLTKKPAVLKVHRVCLFISVFLLAVHLLLPNLLSSMVK